MSSNQPASDAWQPPPLPQAPVASLGGHPKAWALVSSDPCSSADAAEPPPPIGPPSMHLSADGRRLPANIGQHGTDGGSPLRAPNPVALLFAEIAGYGENVAQPGAATPSPTRRYDEERVQWEDEALGKELRKAAADGLVGRCQELLARGASVNAAEKNGSRVPLHLAAQAGHLEIAAKLIEWQANVNAEGRDGATPFDDAYYWYMKGRGDKNYVHVAAGCEAILVLLAQRGGRGSAQGSGDPLKAHGYEVREKQFQRLAKRAGVLQVGQQVQFPWLLPQLLALENGPSHLALPGYATTPPAPPTSLPAPIPAPQPRTGGSSASSSAVPSPGQAALTGPSSLACGAPGQKHLPGAWRLPDGPVPVGRHTALFQYDGELLAGYLAFERGAILEIEERGATAATGDSVCRYGYYVYGTCGSEAGWFPVQAVLPCGGCCLDTFESCAEDDTAEMPAGFTMQIDDANLE